MIRFERLASVRPTHRVNPLNVVCGALLGVLLLAACVAALLLMLGFVPTTGVGS